MVVSLSMKPFHPNLSPVHARDHAKPGHDCRFTTGVLLLWLLLGLLLGVAGALLSWAALPEVRESPHAPRVLTPPFLLSHSDGPTLKLGFGNPEGALPCHHLRTAGCSLECPHGASPPGSAPGLFPDLSLSRPLIAPSPPPPSPGAFRDLPSQPSSDGSLPDPPPRASSLETVTNVP